MNNFGEQNVCCTIKSDGSHGMWQTESKTNNPGTSTHIDYRQRPTSPKEVSTTPLLGALDTTHQVGTVTSKQQQHVRQSEDQHKYSIGLQNGSNGCYRCHKTINYQGNTNSIIQQQHNGEQPNKQDMDAVQILSVQDLDLGTVCGQ